MSNKKNKQLGMPYGTAAAKLRKRLLFKYVSLAGHDRCFKCGNKIETADGMSIEHKKPWLDAEPALFWDLDNVAFSHRECNRPDRYNTPDHLHRKKLNDALRKKMRLVSEEDRRLMFSLRNRGLSCRDIGWLLKLNHESVSARLRVVSGDRDR